MRAIKHPLTLATYELCDEGVKVTDRGQVGVFSSEGEWLSGDNFMVCSNMCGWVGTGPRVLTDLKDHRCFRSIVTKE